MGFSIRYEDMEAVKKLADKYNLSVSDFGRKVASQSDNNTRYWVRYSDVEYMALSKRAIAANLPIVRYCELCCKAFVERHNSNELDTSIFKSADMGGGQKNRRMTVKILNRKVRSELETISASYSIKISTLIRFCSLTVDITEKGE